MTNIKVAFGVTKDWIEHTFVTVCSILSNAKKGDDKYTFYIMSDISEDEFETIFEPVKNKLNNLYPFEYKYIKMVNSDFDGVVHDTRVGISAYYRLKLGTLTQEDKIIYLDSDIVVTDNLTNLWNYNVENYYFAAVEDKYSELMGCHANLPEGEIYINSGVMLMNLKKFRCDNLEEIIFKKLREPENTYSDQDVLNDICRNKILHLPLKYNLMLTRDDPNSFPARKEEYRKSINSPVIMHYSIKPWILPVQYSEIWRKYSEIITK